MPRTLVLLALLLPGVSQAASACVPAEGVVLQILGSGGPIADDGRSSSAYLVWVDGQSRVLVDAGGGAFLRFGEAGASFEALEHVAISHFHTDHSADLVTLLKSGYFSDRTRPLSISGPTGSGPFPSLRSYLDSSIGPGGAYGYLSGYGEGTGGLVKLDVVELVASGEEVMPVVEQDDLYISGIGVPHGIVPAIGYRVSVGDTDVVFGSDQNGSNDRFIEFSKDADILVAHMVVPEGSNSPLHATPGRIGEIAAAANVGTVVLSHLTRWSLEDFDDNVAAVREHFDGDIVIANDLACVSP